MSIERRRQIVPAYWSNQPEAKGFIGQGFLGTVYATRGDQWLITVRHREGIQLSGHYWIGPYACLWGHPDGLITIGNNVWIGPGAFLEGRGWLYIGDNVAIAPYARLLTSQHTLEPADRPVFQTDLVVETTVIEEGAEVGTGAIIMPGVTVGKNALVGAGAVVTHDVPEGMIVVGNPARVLRKRYGGECKKIAESEVAWAVWEAPLTEKEGGRDFFVSVYFPPDQWRQMIESSDALHGLLKMKLEQAVLSLTEYIEGEIQKETESPCAGST